MHNLIESVAEALAQDGNEWEVRVLYDDGKECQIAVDYEGETHMDSVTISRDARYRDRAGVGHPMLKVYFNKPEPYWIEEDARILASLLTSNIL